MSCKYFALIVAAGNSNRFQDSLKSKNQIPKQYQKINQFPIIFYSIRAFSKVKNIEEIHVVLAKDDIFWKSKCKNLVAKLRKPIIAHFCGGLSRGESVVNGLTKMKNDDGLILVHDAARPCISSKDIEKLIFQYQQENNVIGGILATKVSDTIKKSANKFIEKTINRDNFWLAQTPQMFAKKDLIKAYQKSKKSTDEASAIEKFPSNQKILIVEGSRTNIKVTYFEDLKLAKSIINNT